MVCPFSGPRKGEREMPSSSVGYWGTVTSGLSYRCVVTLCKVSRFKSVLTLINTGWDEFMEHQHDQADDVNICV